MCGFCGTRTTTATAATMTSNQIIITFIHNCDQRHSESTCSRDNVYFSRNDECSKCYAYHYRATNIGQVALLSHAFSVIGEATIITVLGYLNEELTMRIAQNMQLNFTCRQVVYSGT